MTHFGILCLAATGHINTFFPLGKALQKRGHRVTVLSAVEAKNNAIAAGLAFNKVYENSPYRDGDEQAQKGNIANIRQTLKNFSYVAQDRLERVPAIVRSQKIDALLVDLSIFEGGTIADYLNIPYITVCCLLPFYEDITIPPIFTAWQYSTHWWAKLRNQLAYKLSGRLARPIWQVINRYRQQWRLEAYTNYNDIFSDLAIITRHIPEFEFPRELPSHFYFTGPFHHSIERPPVDFPYEQLIGKPLIYASMGTLQNRDCSIFYTIATACADLDIQLVLSLGDGLTPEALPNLDGIPIVVDYAPQLELLKRATLTITHAGLNTTLEALSYGVPMVAIPITDDQPAVAARIVWTGAGELIPLRDLNADSLREKISQVLSNPSYRLNAAKVQDVIARTQGVKDALDIIERAFASGPCNI